MRRLLTFAVTGLLMFSMLATGSLNTTVRASSHREAPSTAVDPEVDGTDVYAFVDPNEPTRVNLIMNFIPFQLPQGGPNFYRFDDNVQYVMRIDNNGDGVSDIQYVFRFRTVVSNPNTFLYNTGPVTSLDSPNLNIKQFYSVTVLRGNGTNVTSSTVAPATPAAGSPAGFPFAVPPVNVGPRSTPNYENNLGSPAVTAVNTTFGTAVVFAGQREEGFFIDVASIFDLLGLRPFNAAHAVPLANAPGVDATAGLNISTIAIQVPISAVTANGQVPTSATDPNAVIAVYSASLRPAMIAFAEDRSGGVTFSGNMVQVSRLGNPLVNELLIPLGMKDRFNASLPGDDAQFLPFVLDPEPARLINQLYKIPVPPAPRNDMATVFLTGIPGLNQVAAAGQTPAAFPNQPASVVPNERMRLNLAIQPTAGTANAQGTPNRLGFLGGDNAGFPNGRRVGDDVVDIELRVLAGATPFTPAFNVSPNKDLGDGVNQNDVPFLTRFPYLAIPRAGYDAPTSQAVGTTNTNAQATAPASPTPRP